jgi:phytol kinase
LTFGLIFVSFTFEHSASADARYIAAIVPLANLLRLLIYGLKVATNEGLVNAVSREGRPE